ncbi:MAG: hypothetical protein ACXVBJ_00825 [Flavisolibacter sp.]
MKRLLVCFFLFLSLNTFSQVWQWSVSVDGVVSDETKQHPIAFLWIPENCKKVRAVVVGQHNMIEEGIFEHPVFRKEMAQLGFAVVWVSPKLSLTFDFNKSAGEDFNNMMKKLADSSGYNELKNVPVIPIGHSALASYPWNFAAWNPARTLALISVHGDAPLTRLTGSGQPNPDWGDRNIEGVPGLFIIGEYEWWEDRIQPGFDYVIKHTKTPITFFADAGHGHFDYSDQLVRYISLFIKKAAAYRLPKTSSTEGSVQLRPIDPANGWLMDRWRKDSLPIAAPAPFKSYTGDRKFASWVFDKELASATERFYATARGKHPQSLGFIQDGEIVKPDNTHANYNLKFLPMKDGVSFRLHSFFADSSRIRPAKRHASTPVIISRICGPVKKIDDSTFQISFYRMGFNNPKRSNDIWLLASNEGDAIYKSAVQQADLRFPLWNTEGQRQQIVFPKIPDQRQGVKMLRLTSSSTAGVPVSYYVAEGPVEIIGDELIFTKIPPRAKYPVKVTVVAWQYGKAMEPKLQSAQPVTRTFYILK